MADIASITANQRIGSFERILTWWVLACIVVGILLGRLAPDFFQAIGGITIAEVNLPVAVLIWLMIFHMLMKIDFGAMAEVLQHGQIGRASWRERVGQHGW